MRKTAGIILAVLVVVLLTGCAVTHKYGPYMGRVEDRETKKPLEGVVIFVRFYTWEGTIGGEIHHYADAVETLTDERGEFHIPARRIYTFRFMNGWEKEGDFIIFKPGYLVLNHVPENRYVTMELPRLKTREERRWNLGDLWPGSGVPVEKYPELYRLKRIERDAIGLKP